MTTAAIRCWEDFTATAQTKSMNALDEFEVLPGETLEESLSRAVDSHIRRCSFAEIMRVVSLKRLESIIAHMDVDDVARSKMNELFSHAVAEPHLYRTACRMVLRLWLERHLSKADMFAVKAYEHHLATHQVPLVLSPAH